jgi:nucleotide-binding universal stress UspA family protein
VQDELDARAKDAAASGIAARTRLESGSAPEATARVAGEERADLLVVGTHGRSGLPAPGV